MKNEGPLLETLTRRLSETPAEFLAEPRMGSVGQVNVAAVVSDLLDSLGSQPLAINEVEPFTSRQPPRRASAAPTRNRLSLVLVACWLYHADWFRQNRMDRRRLVDFLAGERLARLAELVAAQDFVSDPDHREELARLALQALDLRPKGETVAQAQDRLTTLDSVERERVLAAAREAEERSRAVLEAMASKAAQDAAAKWSRE
jgi:hypothetical protein